MSAGSAIVRRGYADCRLGQMHYLEGRPADRRAEAAPTLVMLHQNPSSSEEYAPLLRLMAQDRRVIAFDTPGYGMSDRPDGPLSIGGYAEIFSDAIDAMDLGRDQPLDLFGYHTGVLLAAELGLTRPDVIGRLVLSGAPMRTPAECAQRLEAARNSPQPTDDGEGVLAQSAALWRYVVAQRDPRQSLDRAVTLFIEKNRPLHRGWWAYEGVWTYPTRERLARITQPTLFLQPHDALLDQTREASAITPGAVFFELPDLNRDLFDLGADRLAQAMRRFLVPDPIKSLVEPLP